MLEQRLPLIKLQKRLLDADLPRRHAAVLSGLTAASFYMSFGKVVLSFVVYLLGDILLTVALRRLIREPQSRGWHILMFCGAFTTMTGFLLLAAFLWLEPGEVSKIVALTYVFGGMLSVMLVRSVYLPLTIVNSLPLILFGLFVAIVEARSLEPGDLILLYFAMFVLGSYFTITLGSYTRTHREVALGRDAALARAETQKRFLATMSHELRTPLNGILGMAQVLTRSHPGIGAEVIRDNAASMSRMVGDLLDSAAIDAGALRIDPRPCDPTAEIARCVADWQPRFAAEGLALEMSFGNSLPPRIMADPLRLSQCLSNLLSNALRHTQSGGATLVARWFSGLLEITLTDTGSGLPAGAETRLFRPYEQISRAAGNAGGTGLGLSITRGLARAMGGDVTYERPTSAGSRFCLTLLAPAVPETAAPAPVAGAPASLNASRILVVDDIATNRLVLRLLLSSHGVRVVEAASGREALNEVSEQAPCAVLMDLRMPDLSGFDTMELMRQGGYKGPIVAVSADAAPEQQRGALAQGFDGYLTKPVQDDSLVQVLTKVLGQNDQPQPPAEAIAEAHL